MDDVQEPEGDDDVCLSGDGGVPFSFEVTAADARCRLDVFLHGRMPDLSRSRVQALIRSGHAVLNGRPAKPGQEVRAGDRITGEIPPDRPAEAQPQDIPIRVLYEDDDLAVIDKAPGMVVHPAHGNPDGTLVNALLHRFGALSSIGGVQRPGIVHRLDRDTSGCLVTARNDFAHQELSRQFAGRETEKTYLAVVQGCPSPPSGMVSTHIARDPRDRLRMAVVQPPAGKSAVTGYEVIATFAGDALVKCALHTGRTHQIRVHMKHLGHPLLGDELYARPSRQTPVPRMMLHAWRLVFTHPRTRRRMALEAPVPPEFSPWIEQSGARAALSSI